jgi:myo-inositol-1(or 4)-monophosphatase
MNIIDPTSAKPIVVDAAKQAGEILLKFYASGNFSIQSKGGVDFVTQADKDADSLLIKILKDKFPDSHFLTEETAPDDYASMVDVENLWVIDPLDGTTVFSRQINDIFCVSIALVQKGQPQLGVVYLPVKKKVFIGVSGERSAFLNDAPISAAKTAEIGKAITISDVPWDMQKRDALNLIERKMYQHVRANLSLGSAAAGLCYIASGSIDGYYSTGLKPWDSAAAVVLIKNAGGTVSRLDGSEWNIFYPDILASNGLLHDQLVKIIKG